MRQEFHRPRQTPSRLVRSFAELLTPAEAKDTEPTT
jgi:hypothetical protein